MKILSILLALPFLNNSDCSKKKAAVQSQELIPPCVQSIIDAAVNQEPMRAAQKIEAYTYNGRTVYLVTAACCDHYNDLYDENCQRLCAPTGGFTGKGDNKCADFAKTATLIKEVWRNPAKK